MFPDVTVPLVEPTRIRSVVVVLAVLAAVAVGSRLATSIELTRPAVLVGLLLVGVVVLL